MVPTRFGVQGGAFLALMYAAFVAAPYSNLFFLLLGFLSMIGLGGVVAAHRNLRGVTASLVAPPPIPSGANATLRVPVAASGRARFLVGVRLELEEGSTLTGRVEVLDGRADATIPVPALERGCHSIARASLESTHPLGIVRVARRFAAPDELVVYPAPRELGERRDARELLDELLGGGDAGPGDLQPAGLRDHREGDEARDVHWRASARRGKLVVQEWEGGRGQGLEVALDRRCEDEALEEALATLSALVQLARKNKETLRMHSQGLSATFGEGQRPWDEALRFLAEARTLPAGAPAPPASSPHVPRLPRRAA